VERTLLLIKPDAVERHLIGYVLQRVEESGLAIRQLRMLQLRPEQAREFYKVHEGKPFLDSLVAFMSRGPIVAAVLEGERAVVRLRELVGATDPAKAQAGTIRSVIGKDIQENSVHASDSPENAAKEIDFFGLSWEWKASS
jgi:nucleoside-diphosphate kinase